MSMWNITFRRKVLIVVIIVMILCLIAPTILLLSQYASAQIEKKLEELGINLKGWVDEITLIAEKEEAKALDMVIKGEAQIYLTDITDPTVAKKALESPALACGKSVGLYYELTFNPVGPVFKNGLFNPFCNARIREAMNYIIDRKYIVEEIMGGLGVPKYVPICYGFPDYERYKDTIKALEKEYSYNFEKGKKIIFEELKKMGCEYKGGKWYYKGKPIVIKFLIRVEDVRKQIGDYIATQLEKLGFTVERMYKTSKEAAKYWIYSNPAEGTWHLYTGGWVTTAVERDSSENFAFFYTPIGLPIPLWQAYKPSPEFYEVAKKLAEKRYKTIEERHELMRKALKLALKDSVRVWIADNLAVWPRRKEVECVVDLSAGYWTPLWAYTIRYKGKKGGKIKAIMREVFVDPWNPIAGSDWIYDTEIQYATIYRGFFTYPKTGLPFPVVVRKAEIYVEKTVVTEQNPESKYWLKLEKVDKVEVPADAWYAWDPIRKKIVTAGEAGVKYAKAKVILNYGDILGKMRYHDGSKMTLADWILPFLIPFERATKGTKLYDEAYVPSFKTWRKQFIAWKIIKTKPLIIEVYTNYTTLDAELIADQADYWFFPYHPWHMLAIGILAEVKGKAAFSSDKADKLKVEWLSYIGGPSLKILKSMLDEALTIKYIPFKEFMSKYISEKDAVKRYKLLEAWYTKVHHFWVGNGPYFLERADVTAHIAVLKNVKYAPKPPIAISWKLIVLIVIVVIIIAIVVALAVRRKKAKKATKKS